MLAVRVDAPAERIAVLERPAVAGGDPDPQALVAAEREHLARRARAPPPPCDRSSRRRRRARPRRGSRSRSPSRTAGRFSSSFQAGMKTTVSLIAAVAASSARAARSCAGRNGNAASSHAIERRLGATATRRGTRPRRPRCGRGVRRADACGRDAAARRRRPRGSIPRSTQQRQRARRVLGGVPRRRLDDELDGRARSTASRICSASDGPPVGDQPLNTTTSAPSAIARRSASRTSRRQRRADAVRSRRGRRLRDPGRRSLFAARPRRRSCADARHEPAVPASRGSSLEQPPPAGEHVVERLPRRRPAPRAAAAAAG